jgi:hypothetical protein
MASHSNVLKAWIVCCFGETENQNPRTHLKIVDQGSGQGAGRRKSGAYTVVCKHFEPTRNAAMWRQTHF